MPLDNRATYPKSDWIMWTATLTENVGDFNALVDSVYKYANETPSRVPLSDWHDTIDGTRVGFRLLCRGGYFMKILKDKIQEALVST